MQNIFKKIGIAVILVFALIGMFLTAGFLAVKFGLTNSGGIIDKQRENFLNPNNQPNGGVAQKYEWENLSEWQTLSAAILKDKAVITRAAATAGVEPRLIVMNLFVEQMRFFFDSRESYKKYFEPLKILGSQTLFSWGVMGIKPETALQIEANLKNPLSPFYPGAQYEHLLDFHTSNIEEERFTRMTDQHDHYGSYLYAGLYIKQITTQWKKAGFDLWSSKSKRPDIIATLYNVGFANSKPKADPQSGGAPIPVGNRVYSFGSLGGEFYASSVLLDEFPR